jgi:tetratricopeptide (TPR) repeat protein
MMELFIGAVKGWLASEALNHALSSAKSFLNSRAAKEDLEIAVREAAQEIEKQHPKIARDFLDPGFVEHLLAPIIDQLQDPEYGSAQEDAAENFKNSFLKRWAGVDDKEASLRIYDCTEDEINEVASTFFIKLQSKFAASDSLRNIWRDRKIAGTHQIAKEVAGDVRASNEKLDKLLATENQHGPANEIVSEELERRLTRIRRRANFAGTNTVADLQELAQQVLQHQFRMANPGIRASVLLFAARSTASQDDPQTELARTFLEKARELDPEIDFLGTEAWVRFAGGNEDDAMRSLRDIRSREACSCLLVMLLKNDDPDQALNWIRDNKISPNDLTGIGVCNVVNIFINQSHWKEASDFLARCSTNCFEEAPVLHYLNGVCLTQNIILPEYMPSVLGAALPIPPKSLIAKTDPLWPEWAQKASKAFSEASSAAAGLGLLKEEKSLLELATYLSLECPATKKRALKEVEEAMSDTNRAVQFAPLAIAFGVDFDTPSLLKLLEKREKVGGLDPWDLRAAIVISKDDQSVLDLIKRRRTDVEAAFGELYTAVMEIRLLANLGQISSAERLFTEFEGQIGNDSLHDEIATVIEAAKGENAVSQRQKIYTSTGKSRDLESLCHALMDQRDWTALIDSSQELFGLTGSSEHGELVCQSFYQLGDKAEMGRFLDKIWGRVEVTEKLRSFMVLARISQGRLDEARVLAEELASSRNNGSDELMLANIAVESGDWESLGEIVERVWSNRESRDASELLQAAGLAVDRRNIERAMDLVEAAVKKGSDDLAILLGAFNTVVAIGDEDKRPEAFRWFEKAVELSGPDGLVQSKSLRELIELYPGWVEQTTWVSKQVLAGEMPLFIAADGLRTTLVDLLIGNAVRNRQEHDPRKRTPIPLTHGGRIIGRLGDVNKIALDITSLLTLELANCLDETLETFDSLVLPAGTLTKLFDERQRIRFHQPSQIASAKELLQWVASNKLHVVSNVPTIPVELESRIGENLARLLLAAERAGALVARTAPVTRPESYLEEEVDLSDFNESLTDTITVASELLKQGVIDEETASAAIAFLRRQDKGWIEPKIPDTGRDLYLDSLALGYFQSLGLLGELPKIARAVYVEEEAIDRANLLVQHEGQIEKIIGHIDSIREKVRKAVASGIVEISQYLPHCDPADNLDHPTLQLFSGAIEADLFIVDDRSLNSSGAVTDKKGKRFPLATSFDVIEELVFRNAITKEGRYRARHLLRRAGALFTPIDAQEIHYWLSHCSVDDGKIIESVELRAIREGYQRIQMLENFPKLAEMPAINFARLAFAQAVSISWKNSETIELAQAQADWIVGVMPSPPEWIPVSENVDEDCVSTAESDLVKQMAALIFPLFGVSSETQAAHRDWANMRLLAPLRDFRRDLLADVVSEVRRMTEDLTNEFAAE